MAIWHDLPSENDWAYICQLYNLPGGNQFTHELKNFNAMLKVYHLIPKASLSSIDSRMNALHDLQSLANKILQNHPRLNDVQISKQNSPIKFNNFASLLKFIALQAEKKTSYLSQIKPLAIKFPNLDALNQKFLNRHEQQKSKDYLTIEGGSYLEKIDPAHRDFEFSFEDYQLFLNQQIGDLGQFNASANSIFFKYIYAAPQEPFFLWLENKKISTVHPDILLLKDRPAKYFNRVKYGLKDAVTVSILNQLLVGKKNNQPAMLLSTKLFEPTFKMGTPLNAAAFIWALDNQFLTHKHKAGKYHHSSLSKGKKVKCAGLWVVENGKIKLINNSSGHFKPHSLSFYKMIEYLLKNNVLDAETKIGDLLLPEQPFTSADRFIGSRGKYLSLYEYLYVVQNHVPEVKNYISNRSNQFVAKETFAFKR